MNSAPDQSPSDSGNEAARRYWRSVDELADTPAFREWVEREFPQGASELEGVNRRGFLKIMAASFALAGATGLAGCRRPEAHLKPFGRESVREVPGLPVHYASSHPGARESIPLVVETHGSRPTKLEGNPRFGPTGGATGLQTQASILDLYDPDRSTRSSEGSSRLLTPAQVNDRLRAVGQQYERVRGQGMAILAAPSTSPTRERLRKVLQDAYPRMLWVEYEAGGSSHPEKALAPVFGHPVRARPDMSRAARILALDCDFLGREAGAVTHARGFAAGRRILQADEAPNMSRLYVAESVFSQTGMLADHRLRLSTSEIPALAALLGSEILRQAGVELDFAAELRRRAGSLAVDPQWIAASAADLYQNRGRSLVVAGAHLPVAVHQLVFLLNEVLEARGRTVHYTRLQAPPALELPRLAAAIRAGEVDTLIVLGGNPAFDAPADLDWASLQGQVKEVIRHGYYFDETSLLAQVHLASTHFLESWSDGRTLDGTYVPVQPVIRPLFEGISENELLARLAGLEGSDPYTLVLDTFSALGYGGGEDFTRMLADGFVEGSAYPAITRAINRRDVLTALASARFAAPALGPTSLEVLCLPDGKVGDGRWANNGWLQECPDPMTKLTWDNAILISPALAEAIGFDTKSGQFLVGGVAKKSARFKRGREMAPVAELEVDGVRLRGPLHILPGMADHTVFVALGYGRRKSGRIGQGVGFDAYPLLTTEAPAFRTGARLTPTEETRPLANTQEHWSMEGRDIVREANLEKFQREPGFANQMGIESHAPPNYGKDQGKSLQYKVTHQPRGNSLYQTPVFTSPQQWGMSIDLNTCTGCNACVVACQSENNIPIVGKDQVMRGREMHWIRLDRYFASGDVEANSDLIPRDPQAVVMPMACQHCELAPCEQVCPVNATVHDEQGLNVMAYNRCVGTRYCANNCPYKVRRFNFFDWNKREIGRFYEGPLGPDRYRQGVSSELQRMRANPDVSVRMRGVMEKCTFCQQRISQARIAQRVKAGQTDDLLIPDGVIKTACQQVCPTGAIVFGDVADATTAVSRLKESDRDYSVLGYLNTRPRTTYLARLRNPNPEMPDYRKSPASYDEYRQKSGSPAPSLG